MRIENLRLEQENGKPRAAATLTWEECDREPFDLYYETDAAFAEDFWPNPHAFLVAGLIPAMECGEKRVKIDEQVCPTLRTGLETAMGWLHHWYGPSSPPLEIECRPGVPPWNSSRDKRVASFLSGGVDSLATLRRNRLDYPFDSPCSLQDGLFVHGFDIGGTHHGGHETEIYQDACRSLEAIAADAQVTLIPVRTNVRLIQDDVHFWIFKFVGAAVCSVAHVFSKRLSAVSVASSLTFVNLEPEGTHPLLEPNYGSAELAIYHDGFHLSRPEKVKLVAEWQVALDNLRVCTMNPVGTPNCGKCEKCLRTMTSLVAIDKLKDTDAFPAKDVSAEMLETLCFRDPVIAGFYAELIPSLDTRGRNDLVNVIQHKLADLEKYLRWEEERDWKGVIKKLDRRFLGSRLFKSYEMLHRRLG